MTKMAKKTIKKELTGAQDLYNFLFEACNIIRGPVSQDNFKDYITPLLYYKRISDVYDEETEDALIDSGGDKEYASLPEQHRFIIPDGCHWQDVRERSENLGAAIVGAMRQIEIANPDTLYGVLSMFSAQKWTNKAILNDGKIRDLIEHLSKRKLGNKNYPADLMGDAYEILLKKFADDSKAQAGEFYTPRALTDFMVEILNPQLGESFGDFTSGTGGFLTSALNHLYKQVKTTNDVKLFQTAVIGQEWKPLPYLLSITNLLVHDIEAPNIIHCDSLGTRVGDFKECDKVNVIAMNPPYGGSTEASVKNNFPSDMRSSETADLFMVLIMYRLKANGRAAVIVPDGFLFGVDGAKLAIKTKLLKDFNLHTIIRLPGSIFSPYTSIATNILFFNNERVEDAPDGYSTKETWFYRLDMPDGYKHFSKTKPMKLEHCQPIKEWWHDRKEIVSQDGNEKSRCFSVQDLILLDCNFDQCKFPKDEEEILPPAELLTNYFKKRAALDYEIDKTLAEIQKLLGIEIKLD